MTMVEGRGSGVKVEIMVALRIPDVGPLSARKYNGQRLIVFGGEVFFSQEGRAAGGSVIRLIGVLAVGTVGTVDTVDTVGLGHDDELWWWKVILYAMKDKRTLPRPTLRGRAEQERSREGGDSVYLLFGGCDCG